MLRGYGMLDSHEIIGFAPDLIVCGRKEIVQPALWGKYILAPTTNHRLRYKNCLSVYAKDRVLVSKDMKTMVQKFNVCPLLLLGAV